MWRGLHTVAKTDGHAESEIILWYVGHFEKVLHFTAEPGDLNKSVPARELAQDYVRDMNACDLDTRVTGVLSREQGDTGVTGV